MRSLIRRFSLLSFFHCRNRLPSEVFAIEKEADDVRIRENRLAWKRLERYSSRQDSHVSLGGFTGMISYEGDIGRFLPFIEIGQLIGVGKGTVFGLGRYEIKKPGQG